MAEDNTAVLERELYDVKQYASDLSGTVERNKKEIGNLRKEVEKSAALASELDQAKAALAEANGKIKSLEAALKKADAAAANAEKAVAAGKAISDALGQLSSL